MKKALITGVTGQDGAYLTDLLLSMDYEVHGLVRRTSSRNTERIEKHQLDVHLNKRFKLHYGDLADSANLIRLVQEIKPDEIYNLGAMSHVRVSFDSPEYTADVDGIGTLRLLEAIRICGLEKKTRFYQASTSELYGMVQQTPQTEKTPFYPRSPYAVAKLYAYWIVVNYREAYGIHASNGILFNHESPIRGETFVTRKVTTSVVRIKHGLQETLYLGQLDAKRDWGYAPEFVEGMWRMLQADHPDDYVLATNEAHSVREMVERAFERVDICITWKGQRGSIEEYGVNESNGKILVKIDPYYYRPTEVDLLVGDYSKAKKKLGWEPKTKFSELINIMVDADLKALNGEK